MILIGGAGFILLFLGGIVIDSIQKDKSESYLSDGSLTYWTRRDQSERIKKGIVL